MEYLSYIIIIALLLLIAIAIANSKRKDFKIEANKLVEYLGGKKNIIKYESNLSRFIVDVNDVSIVNKEAIQKMGAKVKLECKNAIIKGTKKLYGSKVMATDLRGGASMVLAGLVAKGTTRIDNIEYILRGYENLDEKLNNLGAKIYKC